MKKWETARTGLFFLLVMNTVFAVPLLRISEIQIQNQQEMVVSSLSWTELEKVQVKIRNIGDQVCANAAVEIDIVESESDSSILTASAISPSQSINNGQEADFFFVKNTDFGFTTPPQPGTYRVLANAECNSGSQHVRTLFFSFSENQNISIPETDFWTITLIAVCTVLLLARSQQPKGKKSRKARM